ncbi:MAG: D-alanyl-D-alanine carboxypeptidase [Alphaproteobacteria bacterium]|nr:D-alanyl-D-alanine carboxypeptidase [Alphaproteobacteria bacterium]
MTKGVRRAEPVRGGEVNVSMAVRFASLLAALLFSFVAMAAAPAVANPNYAAIVVHADTGDVLFSRYADKQLYPASLTKMMTLYLLFEELEAGRLSPESKLKVSDRAAGQPPSKLGVSSGSTIDVQTAIEALIVKSANDVAVVVAEAISGTEWQFARKMSAKAKELGMYNTSFRNASGLPNRRMLTTAKDLTILSRRLIQDFPEQYPLFATKSFDWNGRTYRTHNSLVKTYAGADGLKTGYTRRSGFNLATSAERDGERLIGVVLGGRSGRTRDKHMAEILDAAFLQIKKRPTLLSALHRDAPIPRLKPGAEPIIQLASAEAIGAPSLAGDAGISGAIAAEAAILAASIATGPSLAPNPADDAISALIEAAGFSVGEPLSTAEAEGIIEDLNEFEQFRLAAADLESNPAQGDVDDVRAEQWDVQIGAFRDKKLAISELEEAATSLKLTSFARMVAPMAGPDGETFYRARFVALTETEARKACDQMRAIKRACMVVNDAAR